MRVFSWLVGFEGLFPGPKKGKNAERRKYNMRFLNFDLHGFSMREKCRAYRLAIMEGRKDKRLDSHLDGCSECQSWQLDFDNGTLNAQYTSEIWNAEQKPEQQAEPEEDKFEKWEREQGFKPIPVELASHLGDEYGKIPEPTEPHNPYREQLQRDFEEGKAETDRINKLPQGKLRRWLEQPDNT